MKPWFTWSCVRLLRDASARHFRGGFRGERALGELAAVVERSVRICALTAGIAGQADAEFVHAEAERIGTACGSLAMPPQTPTASACALRAFDGLRDQRAAPPGSAHRLAARASDGRDPSRACTA